MKGRIRTKICGITRVEDALAASRAGADAIGLVFYHKSPRYLAELELAQQISFAAGPFVSIVGLFVNPDPAEVKNILSKVPLNVLQFHGDETEAFCLQFERPYLKALRMKPDLAIEDEIDRYPNASGILLDAYRPGVPGGTGEVFDWRRVPKSSAKSIVLAGGLTPENVSEAIKTAEPWAVDVSGGVEAGRGIKDADKIEAFIRNASE